MVTSARQTSIEAYHKIQESGVLGDRQWEVYEVLYHNGPLTSNEAFRVIRANRSGDFSFDSNTRARFTELRDMGLIQEIGKKVDPITKMTGILWDVTDQMPSEIIKRETKDEVIARLSVRIATLERENADLREQLPRQQSLFQGH